ncbi:MAG: hypothetical protein DME99_00350 [Verrucomicrobia bacterium]|nr:MAG: hypothetical protein DME99_00350 [Verrucomicrobiota bacterium]
MVFSATHSLRNSQSPVIFRGRISCCLLPAEFFSCWDCFGRSAKREFIVVTSWDRFWPCWGYSCLDSFLTLCFTNCGRSRLRRERRESEKKAPEFTLPDQDGRDMALADLISRSEAVVLIFYRGFW